ncbi:MAG: hypothetical protein M1500_00245 [Candidatus Marsarchaeota archaeon]|nr:hypothetical protein [Candidatus Marsarchaeota archaeon]MCL5112136.1 hypothetical protein [Candidatus Marsarchaeota archaeon]
MKYYVKIRRRLQYVRIYKVLKKTEGQENMFTRLLLKAFGRKKKDTV